MNNNLMFSSDTGEWDTQQEVIDDLATAFKWDLDICASRPNVCETYFSEKQDAFKYNWAEYDLRYMNPPYGRGINKWVGGVAKIRTGATVCLLPARTDTAMWQKYIPQASQVTFIKGRLKFGSGESWIIRLRDIISDESKSKKSRLGALSKIGGSYFKDDNYFVYSVVQLTEGISFNIEEWLESDKLSKDSAPFPSAFVVFGKVNNVQSEKLASYGWTVFNP